MSSDFPARVLDSIEASSNKSELAFVHLFDLQICFVGVISTCQDLDDNVNSLVFI